jgi:hypothetical protein
MLVPSDIGQQHNNEEFLIAKAHPLRQVVVFKGASPISEFILAISILKMLINIGIMMPGEQKLCRQHRIKHRRLECRSPI